MAKRRKQTKLTSAAAEFIRWARVSRVATVSAEGVPHAVPVCHVLAGQKLYFGSGDDGTKVRNIKANPRITVTVDEYSDHWAGLKGAMIQGRARLIELLKQAENSEEHERLKGRAWYDVSRLKAELGVDY